MTNSINIVASAGATGHQGTGKLSLLTSCGVSVRRMAICDSRIINQTQTVAKVAMEAMIINTCFGIR
ncbi:hypothetical protein D3C71_1673230 [compost metagenome]